MHSRPILNIKNKSPETKVNNAKTMITKSKTSLIYNALFLVAFFLVMILMLKFKLHVRLPANEIVYAICGLMVGGIVRRLYLHRLTIDDEDLQKKQIIIGRIFLASGLTIGLLMGISGFFPSALK